MRDSFLIFTFTQRAPLLLSAKTLSTRCRVCVFLHNTLSSTSSPFSVLITYHLHYLYEINWQRKQEHAKTPRWRERTRRIITRMRSEAKVCFSLKQFLPLLPVSQHISSMFTQKKYLIYWDLANVNGRSSSHAMMVIWERCGVSGNIMKLGELTHDDDDEEAGCVEIRMPFKRDKRWMGNVERTSFRVRLRNKIIFAFLSFACLYNFPICKNDIVISRCCLSRHLWMVHSSL